MNALVLDLDDERGSAVQAALLARQSERSNQ
jgi:hypothetical protein